MINPSTINFTYKKFGSVPPGVLITHDRFFENVPTVPDIYPDLIEFYDVTKTSLKVRIKASVADTLNAGLHVENFNIELYDVDLQRNFPVGSITINTTIEDTVLLSLSPTNASFNFTVGGANPINKVISITSENAWTIAKTAAWLTLSLTSGSNTGSFEIGVITTGLAAGVYTDTVTVNDGVSTKTVAVTFTVSDGNTATDYLYVSPSLAKFGYTIGGAVPPAKNIEINASEGFTAAVSETWLSLTATTGVAGAQIIELSLLDGVDLAALTQNTYTATVTITMASFIRVVSVELAVYQFTNIIPSNASLLFTDDINNVAFGTSRLDSFMQLNFSTFYKNTNYYFEAKLPVFKGGASKDVGVIPRKIIGKQNLIGLADFTVFQPYTPLILNITTQEKALFTETIIASSSIADLKFIKGKKPTNNWLSDLPKTLFLTKKATICFSVLSNLTLDASIEITGAVTKSINVSQFVNASRYFYTVVLPISEIANFTEGHEFTVSFYGESFTVFIVNECVDHSMVYWENDNGCFDSLELTGEVEITPEINRTVANFRKSEFVSENKILDISKPISYKINTGYLHTKECIETIQKMLYSKNIYLQTQNFTVPVIPENRSIPTFQTLRENADFNIVFNHTEE
jgi:hypothetical protein